MPIYYDPKDYHLTDTLISLYPKIQKEFVRWWKITKHIPNLNYITQSEKLKTQGTWNNTVLMGKNKITWYHQFCCPTTFSLIKTVPVYENILFSIYQPGTEIKPHRGWGDHYARIQLGLLSNDQSRLVLEDTSLPQNEGEVIIFDDSQLHWSYNHGSTTRAVLLFDILKEDLAKYKK